MRILFSIIALAAFFAVFFLLTHPHELRSGRWPKIVISMVVVFVVLPRINAIQGIFIFVGMAIYWSPNISHFISNFMVGLLHSSVPAKSGSRPEFRYAKSHAKDGNFDEALKLTLIELEKDPKNYEGLLLAASLCEKLNLPADAILHLEIILNNSDASAAQKEVAIVQKEQCLVLQKHLEAMNPTNKIAKTK